MAIRMSFDAFAAQLPDLAQKMGRIGQFDEHTRSALVQLYEAAVELHSAFQALHGRSADPKEEKLRREFLSHVVEFNEGFLGGPQMRVLEMKPGEVKKHLKAA